MVHPEPPPPGDGLQSGRDFEIIACQRPAADAPSAEQQHVFGVRWASRPDIFWPRGGYTVSRSLDGAAATPIGRNGGVFDLPETSSWANFEQDIQDRRPLSDIYFPASDTTEANLGFLLPFIRLLDPKTPSVEDVPLTIILARYLGNVHVDDAALAGSYWRDGDAPPLNDLLNDPRTSSKLTAFYRRQAYGYLLGLADRFEYAVLLGLATDDVVPDGATVIYIASAQWPTTNGTVRSDVAETNKLCDPPSPIGLQAVDIPGSVAHPAFNDFVGWVFPEEMLDPDAIGARPSSESLIPRAPSTISALTWPPKAASGRLIDHGAVLYDLARFDHGRPTAGQTVPPATPDPALYRPVRPGELISRPDDPPQAVDSYGAAWPPMEGWYHYSVHGVDLLGTRSSMPAVAAVRHHDTIKPPSPGVRLAREQAIEFADAASSETVSLNIDWRGPQDFIGPDTIEFRVAARWHARRAIHVRITDITPVPGDDFAGTATLSRLEEAAESLVGLRLITPDGEFPIRSHGTGAGASMKISRVNRRLPAPNQDCLIYASGETLAHERVAKLPRRPAVACLITAASEAGSLSLTLAAAGAEPVPIGEDSTIYIHLLRSSFAALHQADGSWMVEQPSANDPRREGWDRWLASSTPFDFLVNSPSVIFPHHRIDVVLTPPNAFMAGLLVLDVTAADDAVYVDSPALPVADAALDNPVGNESDATSAIMSAIVIAPPDSPSVAQYHPERYIWAQSAYKYSENASYLIEWSPVAMAYHEVWRVLEGALDGSHPQMPAAALRALAIAQHDKFSMRSTQVYGSSYLDELPGLAPTRALYRIRAVNEAGTPGAWSDIIGPVSVPDVRQPPPPEFTRLVVPARPSGGAAPPSRRLLCEWTQSGPQDDLRFDIEMRSEDSEAWQLVGVIQRGAAPESGLMPKFQIEIGGLSPGQLHFFRIIAVREARDPIDPLGQLRRNIRSLPSAIKSGQASGLIEGPSILSGRVVVGRGSHVQLEWANGDVYRSIEILRQAPGEFRLRRVASIDGDIESFKDSDVRTGTWLYRLRALGNSRLAESDVVQVIVP